MKSSTLACYLESIANAVRQSKSTNVPHLKWTAFKGPRVLHVIHGDKTTSIPIPTHADAVADLRAIFPDAAGMDPNPQPAQGVQAGTNGAVHAGMIALRNQNESDYHIRNLRGQVSDLEALNLSQTGQLTHYKGVIESNARTITNLRTALEESKAEANALRQTVDRMRQGGADLMMRPAPRAQVPTPELKPAPAGDLLSAILADHETPEQRDDREFRASLPPVANLPGQRGSHGVQFSAPPVVVVAFRLNAQGKTLAEAGVTLDQLRVRFAFKFHDPRDATRGGYWIAKDPTSPGTHLMVQRLAEAGAIIGDRLPVGASERLQ